MRKSGRLSIECLILFLGLLLGSSHANSCHTYVANFVTSIGGGGSWSNQYVVIGVADNDQPVGTPDAKGLNLNLGAGGNKVFMGAQLTTACVGSSSVVVTNTTISYNADCSTLGSGWMAEPGHVNLNDGVAGAPGLWLCVKYGSPSNTNLYGAGFKVHGFAPNPDPNFSYSIDLNSGLGDSIKMEQAFSNCGGNCQNGGLCFLGKCDCVSPFSGSNCQNSPMTISVTQPSICSWSISTTGGTGPYKYKIDNGPITSNTLFVGTADRISYTITSFDSNGNTASLVVYVNIPSVSGAPAVASWGSNVYATSAGRDDAFFTVQGPPAGMKQPIQYKLRPASTYYSYVPDSNGKFTNLAAGYYGLQATDADDCQTLPMQIFVATKTVAKPPTGIFANITNANNKAITYASWIAPTPQNGGYEEVTGYVVSWGVDTGSGIVWTNLTVSSTVLSSSVEDTTASSSTKRFVKIATINSVGVGAFSSSFEFQGLCGAGYSTDSAKKKCIACAAGYNTLGFIGKSTCRACAAGTFTSTTASPTCYICTGNTYSKAGAATCTACSPGSVTVSQQYCASCAPGSFASSDSTSCSPCPANTFAASAGSSSCSECAAGETSPQGSSVCTDESGYKK